MRVADIKQWAAAGKIPELYAPTLANIFNVSVQDLYGFLPSFTSQSATLLEIPEPIIMNTEVGNLDEKKL